VPTYQYACTECGEPLEVVQKFTDDPLTECPACHGRLRKVFNSVGIVFKGSGFYRTDSRDSAKSPAPAKTGADAGSSASGSSSESSVSSGSTSAASAGSGKSDSSSSGSSATPATKAATA
jgi:putative FmdB family regulatory protein